MRKTLIIVAIIILALVIFVNKPINLGGNPISPNVKLGSNLTATTTGTAKLILAEASGAQLRVISNVGPSDTWLSSTSTNLAANFGWWLKASSSLIMSGDNLYTGNIYGIVTTTLAIFQF